MGENDRIKTLRVFRVTPCYYGYEGRYLFVHGILHVFGHVRLLLLFFAN